MLPTKLSREEIVAMLVADARELHEAQNWLSETIGPEVLLLLAYEATIRKRYDTQYEEAPPEVKVAIDKAKRIANDASGNAADDLVLGHEHYVHSVKCECCNERKYYPTVMMIGDARPLWTFLYRHPDKQ